MAIGLALRWPRMRAMWGIHSDKPRFDFVSGEFIALGWSRLGDLRGIGDDQEEIKAALATAYPEARRRAIPVWAGMLRRFAFEMAPGDIVVHPHKPDSTLSFGRVRSEYRWEPDAPDVRHRREVTWLHTGVPREAFSKGAGHELCAAMTLFRVRRHAQEFFDRLALVPPAADTARAG